MILPNIPVHKLCHKEGFAHVYVDGKHAYAHDGRACVRARLEDFDEDTDTHGFVPRALVRMACEEASAVGEEGVLTYEVRAPNGAARALVADGATHAFDATMPRPITSPNEMKQAEALPGIFKLRACGSIRLQINAHRLAKLVASMGVGKDEYVTLRMAPPAPDSDEIKGVISVNSWDERVAGVIASADEELDDQKAEDDLWPKDLLGEKEAPAT